MRGYSLRTLPTMIPRRRIGPSLGLVLVIILLMIGTFACNIAVRNHAIDSCRERGGQAITSPWYDGDNYMKVRCIEPR